MNLLTKLAVAPIYFGLAIVVYFIFIGCCIAAIYQRLTR